ncbi:MAG TPA: hypothetical protein VM686_01785 [Polyangiaceae bacterium]|nr:hypothetical protein [Polyangiaceae bacterium]
MSRVPTPVLGFNNNVRHRGRIFHIQTEDSGVRFPRIVTHLFADGGRIIKTAKTDYSEHLERQDLSTVVRGLMKDQHKAMFVSLRAGEYDGLLERVIGPLPEPPAPPPRPSVVVPPPTAPPPAPVEAQPPSLPLDPPRDEEGPIRRQALSNPNLQRVTPSVPPPSPDALDRAVASLDDIPERPSKPSVSPPPPRSRKSNPAPGRKRTATGQRPSAQFAAAPPPSARSIFGDGVGEKSLDEVILSYLAEDLDGGQE